MPTLSHHIAPGPPAPAPLLAPDVATLPPLLGEDGRLLVAVAEGARHRWNEYHLRGLANREAEAPILAGRPARGRSRPASPRRTSGAQ